VHPRQRQLEQPRHLVRHGVEHVLWRRALGDERRHAAERRLLVGQPPKVLLCGGREMRGADLRVGDVLHRLRQRECLEPIESQQGLTRGQGLAAE
jgi:hypothetical protein